LNLGAEPRGGVSAYLEAFVLIGVAMGGSGLVYAAASAYSSSEQGPSDSVAGASIVQGAYFAVERVTVFNTGPTPIASITLSTEPVSSSAGYCYALLAPTTMTQISSTCPPSGSDPERIAVAYTLASGKGVLIEVTVSGNAFSIGAAEAVTATTSAGPQASLTVQVGAA
jgi:hypothetical protein